MKSNLNQTCRKCNARLDYVGHDCIVYECHSSVYIMNEEAASISTKCLQRQIDQLTEKLDNALSILLDR